MAGGQYEFAFFVRVSSENNNNEDLCSGKTVTVHGMHQRVRQRWCGEIVGISLQSLSFFVYRLPYCTTV